MSWVVARAACRKVEERFLTVAGPKFMDFAGLFR